MEPEEQQGWRPAAPPRRPRLTTASIAGAVGIPYTPRLAAVPDAPVLPDQAERLRPGTMLEMIGQEDVRIQLATMLQSAARRSAESVRAGGPPVPPEHCLFHGPPGCGKTTLARIISTFMGTRLIETSAIAMSTPKMLMLQLCELQDGDVLFIDECHRLSKKCTEVLYRAMEEFKLDVPSGSGKNQRVIPVDIAPFTLVGATTEVGSILLPLYDRFGFTAEVQFYEDAQLQQILLKACENLDHPFSMSDDAALMLASHSRGTPRVAIMLMKKVRDVAMATADANEDGSYPPVEVDTDLVRSALDLFGIDELGLNPTDQKILLSILVQHGGGPVGIHNIAATTGEDQRTVRLSELWLIRCGLLSRGQTGRVATEKAFVHMQRRYPDVPNCPPDLKRGIRL